MEAIDCDYRFQDRVRAQWPKDQGILDVPPEMLAPGVQGPGQSSSLPIPLHGHLYQRMQCVIGKSTGSGACVQILAFSNMVTLGK